MMMTRMMMVTIMMMRRITMDEKGDDKIYLAAAGYCRELLVIGT